MLYVENVIGNFKIFKFSKKISLPVRFITYILVMTKITYLIIVLDYMLVLHFALQGATNSVYF